jgi:hypothetical protein
MPAKLDLTGQQFGKLTAIKATKKRDKHNHLLWKCRCECGKIKYLPTSVLKRSKSCGCRGRKNLKGQTFGRLTVLHKLKQRKNTCIVWRCRCQCGKKTSVRSQDLTALCTQSCGCYRREIASQTHWKHGDGGKKQSRLYNIWHGMKKRCSNKNDKDYKNYGGRGITLCKQWQNYVPFKKWSLEHGYREDLQIDRINNDGNYFPKNCQWVSRKKNARNTRLTRWETINGETKSLAEWCEIYNQDYHVVHNRLKLNWNLIDALTKPPRPRAENRAHS